jgi:general secretion pathway protein H
MKGASRAAAADAGFTLLELILVIGIMSIVVVMATPSIMRWTGPQLKADATRLAAALRVTRAAALAQNREMALAINVAERTFASPVVPMAALDGRIALEVLAAFEGHASHLHAIRFFASGRSTGGDIRLRLQNREMRILVNWATGDVLLAE